MERIRYYTNELIIYENGKLSSIQRLEQDSLYKLNGYKVKIHTKEKTYIGFLEMTAFECKNLSKINVIIGKENNRYITTKIDYNDIIDVECILYVRCKNQRNVNFGFNPTEEINEFSKWIIDNNININTSLKSYVIHEGHHIDGYARGENSKPYICRCYKKSIVNLIKLFERYIQYNCVVKDRNELLLEELGLPKYYENIIKNSKKQWSLEWVDLIEFKDNMCPCCNGVKFTPQKSLNLYVSDFKETYKKERRKRELSSGVYYMREDFMPYVITELLDDKYKKYFYIEDTELKQILKNEYNLTEQEIESNFDILNSVGEEIKHDYLLSANYLNKPEYKEILKNIKITEEFDDAIYDVFKTRASQFKKEMTKEIKELAKQKPKKLILKIQECNWGLRTFDEWDNTCWEIYDNMTINITNTYGTEKENYESELTKNDFDKIVKYIEEAKNIDIISDGCDGSAWEFVQYDNEKEIWKFKLGYIYGNNPLENIEKILNLYTFKPRD